MAGGRGEEGDYLQLITVYTIVEKQFKHVSDVEVEGRPKGTPWQFY